MTTKVRVLIRGAGDLATGVASRLYRAGFTVMMTELPEPRAVRRTVAFSECVFQGSFEVEGVKGVRVTAPEEVEPLTLQQDRGGGTGPIPVLVHPEDEVIATLQPLVLVDARMAKRNLGTSRRDAPWVIGLGPGFKAPEDVHAVVETARGHYLGQVLYWGEALPHTGVPGEVGGYATERVLRAPCAGILRARAQLGDLVQAGQAVAEVIPADPQPAAELRAAATAEPAAEVRTAAAGGTVPVLAAISGVLRGLLRDGAPVVAGQKVGDVDARMDPASISTISDKARAVGGGVLEAIMCLLDGHRLPPAQATCPRLRLPHDEPQKGR